MSVSDTTAQSGADTEFTELDVMGPIDYLVVEFPHRKQPGEGLPHFVDLVDRGIIRVLDLAFVYKAEDGSSRRLKLADLGPELAVFEGASANLLQEDDIASVSEVIGADSTAAILIYENRW